MLPKLPHGEGTASRSQLKFGGLDRRPGAAAGSIRAMENLTGDEYPLLTARPPRKFCGSIGPGLGLFAAGKLFYAAGNRLLVDFEDKGALPSSSEKTFCALGERVVVWPDKLLYTDGGGLVPLEASYTAAGLRFGNGTYAGEPAEMNSITTTGAAFPFRGGDAVAISGAAVAANNRTSVVREVSGDGKTLRFYENVFSRPEGASGSYYVEQGPVTLARTVPDLDYLCANENRLWGCKGDTIWCCKLGDPYNWNVFDGISTDAFSVETGTAGAFTGCASFLGYPCFFKEDRIFKVYGDRPSNYQVMGSATLGVLAGSAKSMAVAGETLYYLSRAGFVAWSGGIPAPVGEALGEAVYQQAVACSDGLKYYVSVRSDAHGWELLVFDTRRRLWYREDGLRAASMAYCQGVYALDADGRLLILGRPLNPRFAIQEEDTVRSSAEFHDFTFDSFHSKFPRRLWLRTETREAGASLHVSIAYDGGDWQGVANFILGAKQSRYLPVPIRRCDHFSLKLEGRGMWRLHALEWEFYDGQARRR